MINSYKEKENFLKRIWNEIFHKQLMLEAPVEYTQKEIKMKAENIINYLCLTKKFLILI